MTTRTTTTTTALRRVAAVFVGLAAAAAATYAVSPADGAAPAATAGAATQRAAHRTTLTLEMPTCELCTVRLYQGRWDHTHRPTAWISREKRVIDEQASWRIRSSHTRGMSISVEAPWEGHTGYRITVAFRYGGEQVGDHVSFREARRKQHAAACWEGTRRDRVTLPVEVRRVRVDGVHHRVPGSIAYLPTTQSWLTPMFSAWDGVLGMQEIPICL